MIAPNRWSWEPLCEIFIDLTDAEAAKVRQRIVQALEKELGAKLRS